MATYIVYGPKGCGKTTNREKIAKKLTGDPTAYVDSWEPGIDKLQPGKVHLTYAPPAEFGRHKAKAIAFEALGLKAPALH